MSGGFEALLSAAQRRNLREPMLLLLAGHRPLAFVAGQLLYVVAPLAGLLGWRTVETWAAWLSAPQLAAFPVTNSDDAAVSPPSQP